MGFAQKRIGSKEYADSSKLSEENEGVQLAENPAEPAREIANEK